MDASRRARIPVYLLTGFLGSGKTTLLGAWLGQPALRDAAVIVNELGEVGLDGALLGVADQSLVSGACVCCTGLPGLEQALEDLFWARLERRMPAFPAVAIETTGLADPGPVIEAFQQHPLLRERYALRAVIAVAGAAGGATVIDRHPEAQAQIRAAHMVVVTKTREATAGQLRDLGARLAALNPQAPVLVSNFADLALDTALQALSRSAAGAPAEGQAADRSAPSPAATPAPCADAVAHHHGHAGHEPPHGHHHTAQACFLPLPHPVARDWLLIRLHALADALADDLLRLKGVVGLDDGRHGLVQFSPDERRFDLRATSPPPAGQPLGLTVIAEHAGADRIGKAFFGSKPSA
ncbi:MAG: GTP-binding protein [Pigmentiphaga sp.]|uniref:CobW family GTP-binding protein n=1 Tax=Pigmentiphaga sp. TaxID=1977564 RepID=UPI0029AB9D6B|nr:GTP-binding protein [Pigmentiphaga sp.]MDX3906248.1 GTP-binding protein [Pigmentiphaga sp.]